MNYYFCDVCHYCFEAESLPDSCPDCGKTDYQNRPAIRSAAEKEVQDLLRARDEMGINQLTAFCVSTGGQFYFYHKLRPYHFVIFSLTFFGTSIKPNR